MKNAVSALSIAPDFSLPGLQGNFSLSSLRGKKVLLSFLRNGACALCNLRVHELIGIYPQLAEQGMEVVTIFESSLADMLPYVGQQAAPFQVLSDPGGLIYALYQVENSPEKVQRVKTEHLAATAIERAAAIGFQLQHQEGSNFYRMPADFLLDAEGRIIKAHFTDQLTDHIPLQELLDFAQSAS